MSAAETSHGHLGEYVRDDYVRDDLEDLTDDDLESEIELVSALMVAATASDGPLAQDEIDRLLGVSPQDDSAAGRDGSAAAAVQPKRPEM